MPRKFPPEDCRSDFLACFIIVISYTSVSVAREFLWPRRTIEQILQNKNQMISSSSPAEADCGSSRVSSSSPAEADYGSSPPMEKKIVPPSVHFRFPDHIPQPEPKEEHEKNTFSCIVIDVLSLPDAQTLETIVNDAYTIGEDGMWNDASSTSSPGAPGGGDEGGLVPTTPPAALTPAAAPPTHFRTAADDLTERRVLRTSAAEILDRAKRWEVLVVYASGSEEAELPGVGPPFGRPVGCVCVDRTLRRAEEGAGDAAPVAGFGMLAVDKKVLGKRLGDYLVRCAELWARGEAEAVVQQQREGAAGSQRYEDSTHNSTQTTVASRSILAAPDATISGPTATSSPPDQLPRCRYTQLPLCHYMRCELLSPTWFSHPMKVRLHAWYQRLGYVPDGVDHWETFVESFPELLPRLKGRCRFEVYEKALVGG